MQIHSSRSHLKPIWRKCGLTCSRILQRRVSKYLTLSQPADQLHLFVSPFRCRIQELIYYERLFQSNFVEIWEKPCLSRIYILQIIIIFIFYHYKGNMHYTVKRWERKSNHQSWACFCVSVPFTSCCHQDGYSGKWRLHFWDGWS